LAGIASLLPGLALGQAFGRFGYTEHVPVAGFELDRSGFKAGYPTADTLRFVSPCGTWKPTQTSAIAQTIALGDKQDCPEALRISLTAPGFSLLFPTGLALKVSSTAAPYLTWKEGSVSQGVPSPPRSWLVVSFRDAQPALVLGFENKPTSLTITGQPGDWTIRGPADFNGWVRVGLPGGLTPARANTASALGKLAQQTTAEESMWTSAAPALVKLEVQADEDAAIGTWTFDKKGALLPFAAQWASLGGYATQVRSASRTLGFSLGNGPLQACVTNQLQVRLPVRRIPAGRGISIGLATADAIGAVSPQDLQSVVELAMDMLPASRDVQTRHNAEETIAEYLAQAAYFTEPFTDQILPYDAAGNGLDLAAAQALLMQAAASTAKATSEPNALLTSVMLRRDWSTWLPWAADAGLRRRAAALAAIAGSMCPEPERRLNAGMLQAGLSAERGYELWRAHHESTASATKFLEPMGGIRRGIFRLQPFVTKREVAAAQPVDPEMAFVDTMTSPIRLFGDLALQLVTRDKMLVLQWPTVEAKPSVVSFVSGFEIKLDPLTNIPRFRADQTLGATEVTFTPETAGICEIRLTLPTWVKGLPATVKAPAYSETSL